MKALADIVQGKTVALVGNARSLLDQQHGAEIDAHQVVIRINLGLPMILKRPDALGVRTDVWVAARFWDFLPPEAKLLSFTKMTALGDFHWNKAQRFDVPKERWTHELAEECTKYCACDPGSGLRTLWYLKRKCKPAQIDVYGFDCWKTVSNWSGQLNTPNHNPAAERRMIDKLCRQP